MRGEDPMGDKLRVQTRGSPPHARGRRRPILSVWPVARITPACAGKTRPRQSEDSTVADHPRMRGEDPMTTAYDMGIVGSPPHARGRPDDDRV